MMRRHDKMRKERLVRLAAASFQSRNLTDDAIRAKVLQEVELLQPGGLRAAVCQIDDLALVLAVDGGMRGVDETFEPLRKPVIAARHPGVVVHALLNHGPLPVGGDDETVKIEVETILDSRAINLRDEPAGLGQRLAIKARALPDRRQFVRRLPRMAALSAAHIEAEFARHGSKAAFESPKHARGDA
jgi:hypothetical protein